MTVKKVVSNGIEVLQIEIPITKKLSNTGKSIG